MEASEESIWVPRTKLGRMVSEGKVVSIEDVFAQGLRIQEPEAVDRLLSDLKHEVLSVGMVQKQTDAGEQSKFRVVVAVGNEDGYLGVGTARAKQIRAAIDKAVKYAKLNLTPIRRGCGSWECGCDRLHSLPFKSVGHCGGVTVELLPGPRGLGIVASDASAMVLRIAGVKDCWSRSYGSTKTTISLAFAVYEALRNTFRVVTTEDWAR